MAQGVWGPAARPGEAPEGAREGERPAEEAGGGPGAGQRDSQGGGLGKLLSPARRRRTVAHVRARLGVSERRACRVLGQARSTQRYFLRIPEDEPRLVARIIELAKGQAVKAVCKKLQITEQTYYRWRKEYGGLRMEQAKRFKQLEKENARLKKLLAEMAIDNAIQKEVAEGNF